MKECLEDWESKLEEFAKVGGENHLADEKAAKAKAQQLFAEAKQALTVLPYDTQPLSAFAHYVIARSF